MKKIIYSGVQPSGSLHIGNYYGAVREFTKHQHTHECFFGVADLHAMTVRHDPNELKQNTLKTIATYLACGIEDEFAAIYPQSHVPQHAELAWILQCVARMGWMERMHQFRDKTGDNKERASVGLFTYPILMAADILLYGTDEVPVGDDQKQHIELAKDIAEKFNHEYGETFTIPKAIMSRAPRIMSLHDASKKMSKSDPNLNATIFLTDDPDTIRRKIKKATADTMPFPEQLDENTRPEVRNLATIYGLATNQTDEQIADQFGGRGYGAFKPELADALISEIDPIRIRIEENMEDVRNLQSIAYEGSERAKYHVENLLEDVKIKVGLR